MNFQSSFWVTLRMLGEPCEFYLAAGTLSAAAPNKLHIRRVGRAHARAAHNIVYQDHGQGVPSPALEPVPTSYDHQHSSDAPFQHGDERERQICGGVRLRGERQEIPQNQHHDDRCGRSTPSPRE